MGTAGARPALTALAELDRAEPEFDQRRVAIAAVVLCFDREWNQMFVHDGNSTMYLPPEWSPLELSPGDRVRLTGVAQVRDGRLEVTERKLERKGRGALPKPRQVSLRQLESCLGQWISVLGRVRTVDSSAGRLRVILESGGITCQFRVMGGLERADFSNLVGASVEVRGINVSKREGGRFLAALMVGQKGDVRILGSDLQTYQTRVTSVESLLNRQLGPWTNHPVRLRGTVSAFQPGSQLTLQDPTGVMRALILQEKTVREMEQVDIWGCVLVSSNEVLLRDAWFEVAEIKTPEVSKPAPTRSGSQSADRSRVLTTIRRVKESPSGPPGSGLPAQLRGVLTFVFKEWNYAFLQDSSGAVFLNIGDLQATAGDYVEVTGTTEPGQFAPIVRVQELRRLSTTNLPPPVKLDVTALSEGQYDCKWVQLEGIVRRVETDWGCARLLLNSQHGPFKAIVPTTQAASLTNLVNVMVAVRGACASDLNARGQVVGYTLHSPDEAHIVPLEPIPADPFAGEAAPISSIATFSPNRSFGRRVKVQGVVTHVQPNGVAFLQDLTGGVRLHLLAGQLLSPGMFVEIVGFPASYDSSLVLEEGLTRASAEPVAVVPVRTTAEEIVAAGTNDSMLVQVEAKVLQYTANTVRPRFILQDGDIIFNAPLVRRFADGSVPRVRVGSTIQVRGICRNNAGDTRVAESFRLLIVEPESIRVVEAVPWWTAMHTLSLLGGITAVAVLLLGWTWVLRRQVRRQTQVIRRELKARNAVAESLAYERDLLNSLMDYAPDSIYFKDLDSRYVRVSRSKVENCYRLALERHSQAHGGNGADCLPEELASLEEFEKQLIGKTDSDFYSESHAQSAREEEQKIISTGRPVIGKTEYICSASGTGWWCLVTKMAWRDKHGKILGTLGISKDITSFKEAEAKLESTHRDLLVASRQAGMAEVATSVLHNVGNVLNSVNVSASLACARIKESKAGRLGRVVELLREHGENLGEFMTSDPKGRRVPEYLAQLAKYLDEEQHSVLQELQSLSSNIDHIKEIVTMQQSYARVAGISETVKPVDLVEDALRMNSGALARHAVQVERKYEEVPEITVEKHKVLQVLVNLIRNAKYACDESRRADKRITLRVWNGGGRVRIAVEDNGVGIPPENMTRIFNHGFTTRAGGHGFGLHSGALAARELGGSLQASSDGQGHGAVFTLELPVQRKEGR